MTRRSSSGAPFPATHWTVILGAGGWPPERRRRCLEELSLAYWKPVYTHLRRRWGLPDADARDLAQDFFAALLEQDVLGTLSPERGRFRSYVRAALDNFVRMRHRRRSRKKHGGGREIRSLDGPDRPEVAAPTAPDPEFDREWARAALDRALARMEELYRKAVREPVYRLFVFRQIDPPEGADLTYQSLATRFGFTVTEVTNHLHRARKKFRELVLDVLRETVASESEAQAEWTELFGRSAQAPE